MTSKIDFESTILALFDKLSLLVWFFKGFFLGGMLILGQKACFLGPTIFEIPRPNWYYSTYIYHPPETKENNNDRVMHFLKGLALYILAALLCQNVYEILLQFLFNIKFTRVIQLSVDSLQISFYSCYECGIRRSFELLNLSSSFSSHILDSNSSHSE